MSTVDVFDMLERTWPAAARHICEGWIIRDGQGGGNRVSCATLAGPDLPSLAPMEQMQKELGQIPVVQLRPGQDDLDKILEAAHYAKRSETILYSVDIKGHNVLPDVTAFSIWPPLQIMRDIWCAVGIGPDRIAVMERVKGAKTAILGRISDRAAGVVFVAAADGVAMVHALAVAEPHRRQGLGRNLTRAATNWAYEQGCNKLTLAVEAENHAATHLYSSLGMRAEAAYHYRIKTE